MLTLEVCQASSQGTLVGSSLPIQRVIKEISQAAKYPEYPVLLTGESGTGKELAARLLHYSTQFPGRSQANLINVNCGAIPDSMFESEMFGHKKGAFTGANEHRPGLIENATMGSLFLDEVSELSATAQVKLLRFLEDGKIRKLGSDSEFPVKVRVISATNSNLRSKVAAKEYRDDLYYRLNVIGIKLPPLRDRLDDIPELVHACLVDHNRRCLHKISETVDEKVVEFLSRHQWPGNVRQLFHEVHHAIVRSDGRLRVSDFSFDPEAEPLGISGGLCSLEEVEKRHILRVFAACGENHVRSTAILGISRQTLRKKLSDYKTGRQNPS